MLGTISWSFDYRQRWAACYLRFMKRTIVVCGHGPGISEAVARKFGAQGFNVAIVARSAERLKAAAASLNAAGITAQPFACDLADGAAVRAMIREVRSALGPISVLHWNAYGRGAGDLSAAPVDELRAMLDVALVGMLSAMQEALSDLKAQKGAVLITGGGFSAYDPGVDAAAARWGAMGLAVCKAAQHKTTGVLNARLASEGVYVGEVTVNGVVKGTAFDSGHGTIEASTVADKFWQLFEKRERPFTNAP